MVFFPQAILFYNLLFILLVEAPNMMKTLTFGGWVFCATISYMELFLLKQKNVYRPVNGSYISNYT